MYFITKTAKIPCTFLYTVSTQIHNSPRYNIDNNDDDPLSEQVVEEIRHADAIKDIRYVHA